MRDATKTKRLIAKLKNKEYRDSFVSDHISIGIPFQIKALREQRKWSQSELGKASGMAQTAVSRLENDYASFTLATLRKLASGFDVALLVKFVPFSRLLSETRDLSPKALGAEAFETELKSGRLSAFSDAGSASPAASTTASDEPIFGQQTSSNRVWKVYEPGKATRLVQITGTEAIGKVQRYSEKEDDFLGEVVRHG